MPLASLFAASLIQLAPNLGSHAEAPPAPAAAVPTPVLVQGGPGAPLEVQLVVLGEFETLYLRPVSVRAPGFRLLVSGPSGELREVDPGPVRTYVGGTDDGQLRAWLTLESGRVFGTLRHESTSEEFELLSGPHGSVLRTSGPAAPAQIAAPLANSSAASGGLPLQASASGSTTTAELAIDLDWEGYMLLGGTIPSAQAGVEAILNRSRDDHFNDPVQFNDPAIDYQLTELILRTNPVDPYAATTLPARLDEFASVWQAQQASTPADQAVQISGVVFPGFTGGSYLGGACDDQFKYGVVLLSAFFGPFNSVEQATLLSLYLSQNLGVTPCNGQPDCHIMCSQLDGCDGLNGDFGLGSLEKFGNVLPGLNCLDLNLASPIVEAVGPASLPVVVEETREIQIGGGGFTQISTVELDGVPLANSEFDVIVDDQMSLTLDRALPVGGGVVTLTNPAGSTTFDLNPVLNTSPVLNLVNSDVLSSFPGSVPVEILVGAQPGDIVYLLGSLSNVPTLLPGLVSLSIGNGGLSLFQLGVQVVQPAMGFVSTTVSIQPVPPFSPFYFQAAVIEAALPSLPAPTTNTQSGVKFF